MFEFLAPLISGLGGSAAAGGAESGIMSSLGAFGGKLLDAGEDTNAGSIMKIFKPKAKSKTTVDSITVDPKNGEVEQTETIVEGDDPFQKDEPKSPIFSDLAAKLGEAAASRISTPQSAGDSTPNVSLSMPSQTAQWVRHKPFAPWSGRRNG